jgi:alpha-amylase
VLGPDGYGAVQISPPQEAVVLPDDGYPWWQAYQPVAYDLNSRFGTQARLAAMIATCHAAGIKVYADVVLHHMTAQGNGGVDDNGTTFPNEYDYPPQCDPGDPPATPSTRPVPTTPPALASPPPTTGSQPTTR